MSLFTPGVLLGAADKLTAPPDPWWDNPAAWGRANLKGWNPAWYQDDIALALAKHKKVSVVGPHGMGKTGTDALVAFWFARTREAAGIDWKVITTAGAWRQLQRYLWPEIHKWAKRLIVPLRRDELLTQEIKLRYGQAFPVASDDPANIEGAHATEILYIIDEAKNVPAGSWDAIEGALSAGNAYCLANSTPGKAEGRLYDIHARKPGFEDWHTVHVTLEDAIGAGRIRREWAEARARQWGINSAVYKNRVLGEFSTTDSDGVIPLEWLEAAIDRWTDLYGDHFNPKMLLSAVASDVATAEGADKSVIGRLYGNTDAAPLIDLPTADTMQVVGKLMEILSAGPVANRREKPQVIVDAIGVGTGAVDRLREQGVVVDAYMGSTKAIKKDKTGELTFLNRRAESYWHLRDLLNPAFDGPQLAIPDDPELLGDLVAPKWEQTSTGLIKVEDKDDVRARLGRSPDKGDTIVMLYNGRRKKGINLSGLAPISLTRQSKWRV